jgi:hypothetical protein
MIFTVAVRGGDRREDFLLTPPTHRISIRGELKKQLRPRYHGHQNVILCHLACAPSGIFLQVNERDTEAYLQGKYPGITNIIYLPRSFSNVINYVRVDVRNNTFGKTHYHFLLYWEITSYMSNFDGLSFKVLCNMFPMESSVQELCLKFIIDEYVLQWPQGYLLLVNLLVHIKTKFFLLKSIGYVGRNHD